MLGSATSANNDAKDPLLRNAAEGIGSASIQVRRKDTALTTPGTPYEAPGHGQPSSSWPAQPPTWPVPQSTPVPPSTWPQTPHPPSPTGYQANFGTGTTPQPPTYANPGRPPSDKSVGAALLLTFLFGPLGVFYSSIIGGLILSALFIVVIAIAVGTLGIGLVLLVVLWPISMLWGALSASRKHRRFETWRVLASTPSYMR